ncbi:hypothetical protein [Nonomuraea guangzhouensis]|uniref:Uncharacterized protein n=1 Tax=Nonomuraea guangzhouensis TaxID=1291555 RepID=A0ABW4GII2_9ACTN|nr:hypothetical protein [Nonomuraea guangzhouensis]
MGRHEKPDSPKDEAFDPKSAAGRAPESNKDQNKTSTGSHSADSKGGKK